MLRGVFSGARWGCALLHHRHKVHRTDGAFSGSFLSYRRMHCARPVIYVAISAASAAFRARGRDRKHHYGNYQTKNGIVEYLLHFDFLLSVKFCEGSQSSMPTMASSSATAT